MLPISPQLSMSPVDQCAHDHVAISFSYCKLCPVNGLLLNGISSRTFSEVSMGEPDKPAPLLVSDDVMM
jgi:hypothetical protein